MYRIFAVMLLLCSSLGWAQRAVPDDMDVAVLKEVAYPQIVLGNNGISWLKILTLGWLDNSRVFNVTSGLRVKDERNRFIVRGKLVSHVGLCPHTHPLRAKLKFRAQKAQPCGCSSSVERKLPKL